MLVAVASVLGLSACAQEVSGRGVPSPKLAKELRFLGMIHDQGILVTSSTDAIDMGYGICEELDAGSSRDDLIRDAQAEGVDRNEAEYVIGVAVTELCPRNLAKLKQ
jgi:hypothetical protein